MPDPWGPARLGDLIALEYGRALPTELRSGKGYPVIGSSGESGRHSKALVPGPSIVVGRKGTVGSVIWSSEPSWPIDTAYWVQLRRQVDFRWLYWKLGTLGLERMDSSTGVPGLNRDEAYDVPVLVPPRLEQRRIAEVIDSVDDSVQTRQEIVHKVSLASSRIVDKYFREFTRDCPAGNVEHKTIEAIGALDRPFLKTGPFGSLLKGEDWVDRGIPVVTIGSLRDGYISTDELLYVSGKKAAFLHEYRLVEGDIVFSRVADVGRSAVVVREQSGWLMSSNLMRISVNSRMVIPDYVQLVIAHYAPLREQIRRLTNASGREVVSDAIMRKLRFPWVPIPDQKRLLNLVGEFRGMATDEERALAKLDVLKQGLMHDLLTGRVRAIGGGTERVGAG